jgi:MarR family transcriptional regulator, lower aerobic nicotinate degradation pathway regulator
MKIISAIRRINQFAAKQLANAGSTIPDCQLVVLDAISRAPGSNQTELVAITGVDRSTIAEVIGRLQRTGMISRSRSKSDGRAYTISITNLGSAALMAGKRAAVQAERALLAEYPSLKVLAA